ncbi:MAG: hypothetical protein WC004_00155 [Candidatus Absconditabacterales bacterium]
MNIFSKGPEKVAAELGFPLLGPSGYEELFADINKYIGLQKIDNQILSKAIKNALDDFHNTYLSLQQKAKQQTSTGYNKIYCRCSWDLHTLLKHYLNNKKKVTFEGNPWKLLKQEEWDIIYGIFDNTFAGLKSVNAELYVSEDENGVILILPHTLNTDHNTHDEQVVFWQNASLSISQSRTRIIHQEIDSFVELLEQKLTALSSERYKKEITGLFAGLRNRFTKRSSRTIQVPDKLASVAKEYRSSYQNFEYNENELQKYNEHIWNKLGALTKEYGCKFSFCTSGTYDEYKYLFIEPNREMDDTQLIS